MASLEGAEEALELAERVGMTPDAAQVEMVKLGLGEQANGNWAAFEICDIEPRQNGKNDTIEIRELTGLFVIEEELLIHTAHEFPTANESFLRMEARISACPDLRRKVTKFRYGHGEQAVETKTGRLLYKARTGGGGRGFADASFVVYDEAQALKAEQMAASLPTMAVNVNPQVYFAGSAALSTSTQLWSLRMRAVMGKAKRLAYREYTTEKFEVNDDGSVTWIAPNVEIGPDDRVVYDEESRRCVRESNPAYPNRITEEFIEAEMSALPSEQFLRERLGVFDPLPDHLAGLAPKLDAADWERCAVLTGSEFAVGQVVFGVEVSHGGERASIVAAWGSMTDARIELVEERSGVGWLPERVAELVERWNPGAVGYVSGGSTAAQVGAIGEALIAAELKPDVLKPVKMSDYRAGCEGFYLDVVEGRLLRVAGQGPMDAAGVSHERLYGDRWSWAGSNSAPLVAATVARLVLSEIGSNTVFEPVFIST